MSAQKPGSFQIHSEARGPHWVAWLTQGTDKNAYQSILLVGASKEEAETKAARWAEGFDHATVATSSKSS
jgi:hypothetical protein